MEQLDNLINCFMEFYEQLSVSAISILRSADSANDAMQNVAVHLLERGDRLPSIHNYKAYLFTCVRNEALMLLRENKHTTVSDPSLLSATKGEQDRAAARFETEDFICAHLQKFSPEMQEMFLKYALDGYTPREIAAEYGLKPNTVSQKLYRMKRTIAVQTLLYTLIIRLNF